MALPPQKLISSDLFIVNRQVTGVVKTYKTTAVDIGVFLLENARPGGNADDKYVNDGELNVYGVTPGHGLGYINLHSANEYCEGKLNFKEGFYITGADMDVSVELDYSDITDNLACVDGGLDGSTSCLKLDMVWLSENIICDGKGLDNSCGNGIGIFLCDHSGLQFEANGCLQVNLCDKGIIHHPSDGCLMLDLNYAAIGLSCNGLRPADGNVNSECIEIDMEWLSNNIRCGDLHRPDDSGKDDGDGLESGLIDGGGCIAIDPCWVGDRFNVNNPQYEAGTGDWPTNANINHNHSIDTDGCKMRVNMEWISKHIRCGDRNDPNGGNSGLVDGTGCIRIDPCWVGDQWSSSSGSVDTNGCDITVNEPWLLDWNQKNIKDINYTGSSCMTVTGGNLFTSDVNINLNESCLVDLILDNAISGITGDSCIIVDDSDKTNVKISFNTSCAGTGGGTANDGKLKIIAGDNGIGISVKNSDTFSANQATDEEWTINMDPASCPSWDVPVSGRRFFNKSAGNYKNPAWVCGTEFASNGDTIDGDPSNPRLTWMGIGTNVNAGSFQVWLGEKGWQNIDDCGGSPISPDDNKEILHVNEAADGKKLPIFAAHGMRVENGKGCQQVRVHKYIPPDDPSGPNDNSGPETRGYNRFCWVSDGYSSRSGDLPPLTRDSDPRVNIDIDSALEAIGGFYDDPEVEDGLLRWGAEPVQDGLSGSFPFLYIDSDELAARLPGLVRWAPNSNGYKLVDVLDPETGEYYQEIEPNPDFNPDTDLVPGSINEAAVTGLALAALIKQKKRIEELEAKTTREGMLNVLGLIEYTNETAAANSGLGQGEVYWDLELNRMRAVT